MREGGGGVGICKSISGGDRRENISSKIGFDFANLAEGGMQVFAGKHCLAHWDLFEMGFSFSVSFPWRCAWGGEACWQSEEEIELYSWPPSTHPYPAPPQGSLGRLVPCRTLTPKPLLTPKRTSV